MEYIKVSQATEKLGHSPRRVRLLCAQNRIDGVVQKGKLYLIPEIAPKPVDARMLKGIKMSKELTPLLKIDALKAELDKKRPFTQGEAERLRDEFIVDFTYNLNAIEGNTLTFYAAFDKFYKTNNAKPMTELVAGYVIERMKQYLEILK